MSAPDTSTTGTGGTHPVGAQRVMPITPSSGRVLWCPKAPDGELRLSMLGATMWIAWGRLEEASGDDLTGLQKRGWKVVQIGVQEMESTP